MRACSGAGPCRGGPRSIPPTSKAVHVEDHPIDYADFHGSIPEGQYGAGTVETWDRGTWEPLGDPEQGMQKGELRFVLHGQRLHGRFTLVRLGNRRDKQEGWFLIKGHDGHERPGVDALTLEAEVPPPEPPSAETADRATPPAQGAVRGAAARDAGAAARQRRRGAARDARLDLRSQVRRLPPAGGGGSRQSPAAHPERP